MITDKPYITCLAKTGVRHGTVELLHKSAQGGEFSECLMTSNLHRMLMYFGSPIQCTM